MRLKLSLKNSAKAALLFSFITSLLLFLSGCQNQIEPTYKEEDIPGLVKKICKDEYKLDVITKRTPSTLWVYAPLPKILDKEYGIKEDKIFDEEMVYKLSNILVTIGRVLVSSNKAPDFYAIVASDINLGLDYTIIANTLDTKKSQAGCIPWTEANRRYVARFKISPETIGDTTGMHLEAVDITMSDFLAEQIAQRIGGKFQDESLKKYFKVAKSDGRFNSGTFIFDYSIEKLAPPEKEIDIRKEILKIVTYCIQTYEFKNFETVEINDTLTQDKLILSRAQIWKESIK